MAYSLFLLVKHIHTVLVYMLTIVLPSCLHLSFVEPRCQGVETDADLAYFV